MTTRMIEVPGSHSELGKVLELHMQLERIRSYRSVALRLLALCGGFCWIAVDWPNLLPRSWRWLVLAGWPAMLVLFLVLLGYEYRCGVKMARLLGPHR